MVFDATLIDGAYLVSAFNDPGSERGVGYDDPAFGIRWPTQVTPISPKDAAWPGFDAGHVAGD